MNGAVHTPELLGALKNAKWLLEGIKRAGWVTSPSYCDDINLGLQRINAAIVKAHEEQTAVDPDVRLVADIINIFEGHGWQERDVSMGERHRGDLTLAVEYYRAARSNGADA